LAICYLENRRNCSHLQALQSLTGKRNLGSKHLLPRAGENKKKYGKKSAERRAQIICREKSQNGLAGKASRLDCNSTLPFDGNYSVIRFFYFH